MSNEFQESIFSAIDTLVQRRIDTLDKDKTVTATIDSCVNLLESSYTVKYQGGIMYAYAQEGASYTTGQTVYVLVPEGDFSNRKIIVGKASGTSSISDTTFVSSLINDYNTLGLSPITDPESRHGLYSYRAEDFMPLYYDGDVGSDFVNKVEINQSDFKTYVKQASAVMIKAKFNTANLSKAHRSSKTGDYGIIFELEFADRSAEGTDNKLYSYILSTSSMTGNPMAYSSYVEQYAIFAVDAENFEGIHSISAYSKGFEEKDDNARIAEGADIFVKDIEIYALKEIDASNGDYTLKLSTPHGSIFKESDSDLSTLDVVGRLLYKDNTDITDSSMFYWFKEDGRVTATSSDYHLYGGAGWSYLGDDAGHSQKYTSHKVSNRSYENNYLCVCVYKEELTLKTYFTLYNDSEKRDIEITASPSTRFSFDRGEVSLTCSVDGQTDYSADHLHLFVWSKVEKNGSVTVFSKTVAELNEELADARDRENYDAAKVLSLNNQIAALSGVEWEKNRFKYPVKAVEDSASFKCSVYRKDKASDSDDDAYLIGSASITITNESAASPTDYYIVLENGDQVFQYSESGVSPCDERYTDPLDVYSVGCHFYDPAGLEVDNSTYSLKWRYPLESTLIKTPSVGMTENPSNGLCEWFTGAVEAPISIADDYDYQALNNQITAIVTYDGIEYTKDTNFLFLKVGDNGTNGTDVVAKVSLTGNEDGYPYIATDQNGNNAKWSDGSSLSSRTLYVTLYQRNQTIDSGVSTNWSMSGGNGYCKNMSVSGGTVSYVATIDGRKYSNQIVKATATYDGNNYYAFYPVPTVKYTDSSYTVVINKAKTLKDVLYNSDGRNPQYNKNQGVFLNVYRNGVEVTDLSLFWEPVGGLGDLNGTSVNSGPDFKVIGLKNDSTSLDKDTSCAYNEEDDAYRCYVLPNDTYTGEFCNNMVHAWCDKFDVYVPIHMSLNTFGLASLNAWDGNSVEINQDSNYILAPQIGAGVKDSDNRFTGIVMGTSKTYDQTESQVGLLGYRDGEQSIFLDAKTGKAVFGLQPTVNSDGSGGTRYTEGRIELVPGGTSTIGNWKIGSDFLYNVIEGAIGEGYDTRYKRSIPPDKQGIMLSADPSYISVKGRTLTQSDLQSSINAGTNIVLPDDSFELELNPNRSSLFTIYRHTQKDDDGNDTGTWRRTAMVGIDDAGRFYTNSIKEEGSALTLNYLPAFGKTALEKSYRGVNIEVGASTGSTVPMIKFFVDQSEVASGSASTTPVYISGGDKSNEYKRPMFFNAKQFALYASSNSSTSKTSDHLIAVNSSDVMLGHYATGKQANVTLSSTGAGSMYLDSTFSQTVKGAYTSVLSGALTESVSGAGTYTYSSTLSTTVEGNETRTNSGTVKVTSTGDYSVTRNSSEVMSLGSSQDKFGNSNSWLKIPAGTGTQAEFVSSSNMLIRSATGALDIINNAGSTGIRMQALATAGSGGYKSSVTTGDTTLLMMPNSAGNSYIRLAADNATSLTVGGTSDTITVDLSGNTQTVYGVSILPGVKSNWGYFGGTIGDSYVTLVANRDIVSLNGWVYASKFKGADVELTGACTTVSLAMTDGTNEKVMGKDWFDAVQSLYNAWVSGSFSVDLSGYVTSSSLSSTLSSYAKKGSITQCNLSTSGSATVTQCATAINLLCKEVRALLAS